MSVFQLTPSWLLSHTEYLCCNQLKPLQLTSRSLWLKALPCKQEVVEVYWVIRASLSSQILTRHSVCTQTQFILSADGRKIIQSASVVTKTAWIIDFDFLYQMFQGNNFVIVSEWPLTWKQNRMFFLKYSRDIYFKNPLRSSKYQQEEEMLALSSVAGNRDPLRELCNRFMIKL